MPPGYVVFACVATGSDADSAAAIVAAVFERINGDGSAPSGSGGAGSAQSVNGRGGSDCARSGEGHVSQLERDGGGVHVHGVQPEPEPRARCSKGSCPTVREREGQGLNAGTGGERGLVEGLCSAAGGGEGQSPSAGFGGGCDLAEGRDYAGSCDQQGTEDEDCAFDIKEQRRSMGTPLGRRCDGCSAGGVADLGTSRGVGGAGTGDIVGLGTATAAEVAQAGGPAASLPRTPCKEEPQPQPVPAPLAVAPATCKAEPQPEPQPQPQSVTPQSLAAESVEAIAQAGSVPHTGAGTGGSNTCGHHDHGRMRNQLEFELSLGVGAVAKRCDAGGGGAGQAVEQADERAEESRAVRCKEGRETVCQEGRETGAGEAAQGDGQRQGEQPGAHTGPRLCSEALGAREKDFDVSTPRSLATAWWHSCSGPNSCVGVGSVHAEGSRCEDGLPGVGGRVEVVETETDSVEQRGVKCGTTAGDGVPNKGLFNSVADVEQVGKTMGDGVPNKGQFNSVANVVKAVMHIEGAEAGCQRWADMEELDLEAKVAVSMHGINGKRRAPGNVSGKVQVTSVGKGPEVKLDGVAVRAVAVKVLTSPTYRPSPRAPAAAAGTAGAEIPGLLEARASSRRLMELYMQRNSACSDPTSSEALVAALLEADIVAAEEYDLKFTGIVDDAVATTMAAAAATAKQRKRRP